ncbi:MAG: hypothetical protein ACK5MQ_11860 [Pikeienuella sp.]
MKRLLAITVIALAVAYLPGLVVGTAATIQARHKFGSEYRRIVPKGDGGPGYAVKLSADGKEPFAFWRRVLLQGTRTPWFGIVPAAIRQGRRSRPSTPARRSGERIVPNP